MSALLEYLETICSGPIADPAPLDSLLAACWGEFDGADADGMEGYKLLGRMESISWDPPVLSFTIERHGGTVLGSKRAALQHWEVHFDTRSATTKYVGHRQVQPNQPTMDFKRIAAEIAGLISDGKLDPRLRWTSDGAVGVLMGEIVRSGSAAKQTVSDRRKRLRQHLEPLLLTHGWEKIRANVYAQPRPSSNSSHKGQP